jgi:hypothetical protein
MRNPPGGKAAPRSIVPTENLEISESKRVILPSYRLFWTANPDDPSFRARSEI